MDGSKGATAAYMPQAKSVDHITPACVGRVVARVWPEGIDLDPFASRSRFATITARTRYYGPLCGGFDGLTAPWRTETSVPTRVYFNPPYGLFMGRAVSKCAAVHDGGNVVAIALLKACTDTKWFHESVVPTATAVCLIRGRLHYVDGETGTSGPAPFPSMLVLWDSSRFDAFREACEDYVDADRQRPLGPALRLRA